MQRVEVGHVHAEVRRARVRVRGVDRVLLDVPVLEHLEEALRVREAEDRHVQLDAGVADELLDVGLVAHPVGDQLEAEQVAVEGDRALQVGHLDAEVADALDRAGAPGCRRLGHRSPIRSSGSSGCIERQPVGVDPHAEARLLGSGAISPSATTGREKVSLTWSTPLPRMPHSMGTPSTPSAEKRRECTCGNMCEREARRPELAEHATEPGDATVRARVDPHDVDRVREQQRLGVVRAALLVAHADRDVDRAADGRDGLRVAGRHDVLDPAEAERLERADVLDGVAGTS